MSTFLFDSIIFGPVWSRRLGESLGINLLPVNRKVCNFSCIYCECGLTTDAGPGQGFPLRTLVHELLKARLLEMKKNDDYLDSITFAGNGEPTLHPDFPGIMDDALVLRDLYFPKAKVAVLSNATLIGREDIFHALLKADLNILKLDSAKSETIKRINCPKGSYNLKEVIAVMKRFNGRFMVQTLFFRGIHEGSLVDNTTVEEIDAWLDAIRQVRPSGVMIYSIARDTAVSGLERISPEELAAIAARVEKAGFDIQVTP
jgi:wyosine [tRNA(Phe)-imidazoG37] synthetase (radical SAM superfamily)